MKYPLTLNYSHVNCDLSIARKFVCVEWVSVWNNTDASSAISHLICEPGEPQSTFDAFIGVLHSDEPEIM